MRNRYIIASGILKCNIVYGSVGRCYWHSTFIHFRRPFLNQTFLCIVQRGVDVPQTASPLLIALQKKGYLLKCINIDKRSQFTTDNELKRKIFGFVNDCYESSTIHLVDNRITFRKRVPHSMIPHFASVPLRIVFTIY